MSSCLSGGGRTYGFDLDIVKPQSPSIRSSHSSSPSSTLSESSNSTRAISTKRARTPRKRPNQSYTEAAALLSRVHPKVFSSKNLGKLCKHSRSPYDSFVESSELLPPFPAIGDAGFLIHDQSPEKPSFRIETKSVNSRQNVCGSPPSVDFRQPGSPVPLGEDFDADSILDEESGEGIDSIMGNLAMDNNNNNQSIDESASYIVNTSPYFESLKGFGLGAKFELGFGFGLRGDLQRALRQSSDEDWWKSPTVMIRDIIPKFKALPPPSSSSEKKKKKKKKLDLKEVKASPTTAPNSSQEIPRPLLLKLNFEEVVKEWSDREHPIPDAVGSPESSAEALARLAEIELFPAAAGGGGVREASVMRYKEKRRSRLFSKKIRYQVRKVNADRRPRMKASGRFVRRPELLQEAIEEENK